MRRSCWPLLLLAGAAALTAVDPPRAEAVIVRHDRTLDRTVDLGARFPFVCAAGGGSGTLIEPEWVLTAAHVVENFGPFDYRVRCAGREYAAVRVFVHPGDEEMPWDRRTHDVALLLLERPVEGVTPAPLYRDTEELGEMQELGKTGVIVGTGFFGTAGDAAARKDGRLRAVTNRISDAEELWLKTVFSRPPGGTDLEGLSAAGDSGGPLLIESAGRPLVVGVSSYAEYIDAEGGGEHSYGAMDFFVRVNRYVSWVDSVIAAVGAGRTVPSEGAGPPAEIRAARDGLPATPIGRRAAAYFEAFNSGDPAVFAEFARQHRAADEPSESEMKERLETYDELIRTWGRLAPLRYAATGPRELHVLARSDIGEIAFGFAAEPQPPHRLVSISISY